jgi:hypothetical protein
MNHSLQFFRIELEKGFEKDKKALNQPATAACVTNRQKRPSVLADNDGFQVEVSGYFGNSARVVAYTQCKMVGWAFLHPALKESTDVGFEETPCVGVSGRRNGAFNRLTLSDYEFEFSIESGIDAQHRNRPFHDLEFHTGAKSGLSVVFGQAAQNRFSFGDGHIMRPVMAYEHKTFLKIDRVKFGKAAAYA